MVNPGAHYRCPEACEGPFAVREPQRCLQYCRHKCRRLQYCSHKCRYLPYCLCQVGCGALFPQAYRVWSRYRVLTLCAAFSVRPWSLPSGNPRSDGSSRYWPCQSEKSGKQLPTSPRSETRSRSRKQRFGPGLPIGESARRRPAPEAIALVGEVGRRSCRAGVRSFDGPSGQ